MTRPGSWGERGSWKTCRDCRASAAGWPSSSSRRAQPDTTTSPGGGPTMARSKPKWTKKTLKLKKNHGWQSRPGYNIFVADRGAVRFDFPRSWIIEPGENGSIKFHDKKPPDDDCTLQITVMYLPDGVDWS